MKTHFDYILKNHNSKFGFKKLNFSKERIKKENRLLQRGMLIILLTIITPTFFIALYTNNAYWLSSIGFPYLFFFYFIWFIENPHGINKFSDSNIKFSFKSWIDEDRINDRVSKMSVNYNTEQVKELRNIATNKLENLRGFNFKKIEIITLSVLGLFVTKFISVDMIYRLLNSKSNCIEPLSIIKRDFFIFGLLVLLIVLIILYQITKRLINQKWIGRRKTIENFIKDLDDINIIKIM